ncbi:DNA-binding GntR family transcriptional regulator [Crossiella equi]|uniref:DNA-binding GntR family transcriptional regulator n=1 Tax=Crossiella equi TaxID=130796 RepID=A0ABS5AAL1_9PSEU|nr:GntR family transcriptional regulator [Crossiella equi]MBP2472765.1 DNA-binding GntR family transcriptional regulator [Crossiella equi]
MSDTPLGELSADRELLGRSSTAERVAAILRERVTAGFFHPGERLSEEAIGQALGVSRNTLREAFRLLSHERLLTHQMNRGVFVRTLTVEDVVDLYRVRRVVESAGVRNLHQAPPEGLPNLREAVEDAYRAATDRRWRDVGTANMRFHQAIVALADSRRLDELMRHLLAELRLVFLVMNDPKSFHVPFMGGNREILDHLESGDAHQAEEILVSYLDDAEQTLVRAYAPLAPGLST